MVVPSGPWFDGTRRAVWLAWRDLTAELRGRAGLLAVVFFLGATLFTLGLAFGPVPSELRRAGPGVLWVALALAGSLLAGRAFALEVEDRTLDDLLLFSGSREWIYFGKLLFQLVLLGVTGLGLLGLVGVLFYLPLQALPGLLLTLALGVTGYSAIGTFHAGMLARLPAREVLLPLLLFPLTIPVLLGSVRATAGLVEGLAYAEVAVWWRLLAAFDAIYVSACALLFPSMLQE